MRRPLPALGAVLVTAAVLATPGTAMASEPLAPGGSQTLDVSLPAEWASGVDRLGVSVTSLTQFENDCVEPETESGDDSCGDEEGELADFLEATVAGGVDGDAGCQAMPTGVTLDLLDGEPSAFDVDGVDCLVLRLEFPDGGSRDPDNRAQSDSISFSLAVVGREKLTGRPSSGDVEATPSADPAGDATSGGATSGNTAAAGGGAVPAAGAPTGTGTTTAQGGTPGGAAGGAAAAGAGAPAGAAAPADAGGGVEAEGPVLGRVDTPVTVDDGGVAVATESASTSLVGQALAWGSMFLGAVVLGGLVFLVVRRRRLGRAA
ncbi:hypothetical protein [Geodermatophilus sp. CPCC 205761]|uniref:hypothetical protein n=1 Tax=Geodermatophilus sp. CPCC 205761 TaxID=2936597 RepID=UPI003EED0EDB